MPHCCLVCRSLFCLAVGVHNTEYEVAQETADGSSAKKTFVRKFSAGESSRNTTFTPFSAGEDVTRATQDVSAATADDSGLELATARKLEVQCSSCM